MDNQVIGLLLGVFIVVILPVSIVLICSLTSKAKYSKKISFLEKCVENGVEITPRLLGENKKSRSSLKIMLLNRLMIGIVALAFGICMVINGLGWMGFPLWLLQGKGDLFFLMTIFVSAIGIGMLVWYFVGKKMLADDIRAEQEQIAKEEDDK